MRFAPEFCPSMERSEPCCDLTSPVQFGARSASNGRTLTALPLAVACSSALSLRYLACFPLRSSLFSLPLHPPKASSPTPPSTLHHLFLSRASSSRKSFTMAAPAEEVSDYPDHARRRRCPLLLCAASAPLWPQKTTPHCRSCPTTKAVLVNIRVEPSR